MAALLPHFMRYYIKYKTSRGLIQFQSFTRADVTITTSIILPLRHGHVLANVELKQRKSHILPWITERPILLSSIVN